MTNLVRAFRRTTSVVALSLVASASAQAQLITSYGALGTPNTTITDFGLHNTSVGNGHSAFLGGPGGVTMSYTGSSGLYFDYCSWGLGSNGSSCVNSVGVNQGGILRFSFGTGLVSGAGFTMNYAPNVHGPVYIRALDASNTVLAQYDMDASAPIVGSAFQFRGIQFGSSQIAAFELEGVGGPSPIISDFSYTSAVSTVPEPSSIALFSVGALAIGIAARRRKTRA